MNLIIVKDLMVPLSEYAVVDEDATLFEALAALEHAQEQFDTSRDEHRAILVREKKTSKIVGKLSQLDVIRSLEPNYEQFMGENSSSRPNLSHFGFSPQFMSHILEQYELWYEPLEDICARAGKQKVKKLMQIPTQGEYVKEDANLGEAVHLLIMGHHQGLLVTKDDNIVGILRLTDIFKKICIHSKKLHRD